jgi:thymidylate synthase (FAD)
VKFGSEDKAKGFDAIIPESIRNMYEENPEAHVEFMEAMDEIQDVYDRLRELGVPAEDARYVLPNAATCNLVLTGNLRSLLDFYAKRGEGTHAQWEIQELAEKLKESVIKVEYWTKDFWKVTE